MSLRAEIEGLLERYCTAYDAGDADTCAALYALDGQIFSPYGPPAKGRAEVLVLHRAWLAEGEENKQMALIQLGGSAEEPWCLATYSGETRDPEGGAPHVERGVALHVFRRDRKAGLQIVISSLNALEAPQ